MLNQQAPEKRVGGIQLDLQVHSIFSTIQGEGPFCGTPATFIRLAGCNLQCPGCDTDYTSIRKRMTVTHILDVVSMTCTTRRPGLVVITGGEPFRQQIGYLIDSLLDEGFFVQIETNGTLPIPKEPIFELQTDRRSGAYIVCSPKTGGVHASVVKNACAFKYVMHANSVDPLDGLPLRALGHVAHPRLARAPAFKGPIYLQPMDSQDPEQNALNRAVCVASCLKHGYILQLQVHKLLGME